MVKRHSALHKCLALKAVSKTTSSFNQKPPANDFKPNSKFYLSQIISLWTKMIGNFSILPHVRSFHLECLENCCLASRLCVHLIWNLLKLLIKKKLANELSIETRCKFNACHQKMPKHHFLGTKIWCFTLLFFIWGCDISLQIFYPFIDLMHKINLHCPKCMFKRKLLKQKCWLRPLVHLKRCHFLIFWSTLLQIVANYA